MSSDTRADAATSANAEARVNVDADIVVHPYRSPPDINSKDTLSNLPDDCLLRILSNLDRNSLDCVACLNQRLRPVTLHSSLRHIKKGKRMVKELEIFQTSELFCFIFRQRDPADSHGLYVLHKSHVLTEAGEAIFGPKAEIKYTTLMEEEKNRAEKKLPIQIHTRIFNAIAQTMSHAIALEKITFTCVAFGRSDLSWCQDCSIFGDSVSEISFNRVVHIIALWDCHILYECVQKLIASLKPTTMRITQSAIDVRNVLNNNSSLLRGIKTGFNLFMETQDDVTLYTELLPYMGNLQMPTFVLPTEKIISVLVDRLRQIEGPGCWKLCVQFPDRDHHWNSEGDDFKVERSTDGNGAVVRMSDPAKFAQFTIEDYKPDENIFKFEANFFFQREEREKLRTRYRPLPWTNTE